MIISVNWLKKFTKIDTPIDELVDLIGSRLVEIERVTDLGAKYSDVVVAKVVECHPLENSDHLNLTKLDDGGAVEGVERDEQGYVQVVCGAPNVRAGLLVAWLPPGSTVPETYDSADPFVLGARMLRGVKSNGMIASAKELDLFDDHTGILELDQDIQPGSSFAKSYELDDYLLDIENKSLTHRPDTFGIIGFAREVAAIQGEAFATPEWLLATNTPQYEPGEESGISLSVTIDDPTLSSRYEAVVLSGADGSAQSPLFIQTYLARVGVRPISAVVDVTNYLMMLTGQPLHAFDYDKVVQVAGGTADIHVRTAREGETLALLDGRTITLSQADIVIAAGETAIGLAGAMGGLNTEIDDSTKNIVLESATFNLYNLRATQMRHGIFSEAITRFTKGQPGELTAPVLVRAVEMMHEFAGARPASAAVDDYPGKQAQPTIEITLQKINEVLGSAFASEDVRTTLENTEFQVDVAGSSNEAFRVTPPYWRSDIHIPEDIIEEIGRLNGFDTITPRLPLRDFTAVNPAKFDELRSKLRQTLVRAGASEVLSYSFVHGDLLKKAQQTAENSYRIVNSLSPDLQYYRQSLTPSLLSLVHPNVKNGYDSFGIFELNKAHLKSAGQDEEGVPKEINLLAFVLTSQKSDGTAFYAAKRYLDYVGALCGMTLRLSGLATQDDKPLSAPFDPRRSANVTDAQTGEFIGIVGEYKQSVARHFKLPPFTAGFEVYTEAIEQSARTAGTQYTPLSRYPSAERDVCFQVASSVTYAGVFEAATDALRTAGCTFTIVPVDIYQAAGSSTKNITLRFRLTSNEKTLTGGEVAAIIESVTKSVNAATGAAVV